MKVWIVAVFLTGCGSSKEASSESAARPTVGDPLGFCARARAATMGRLKCFPEDASIKMALDGISDLENRAPADPEARRRAAAQCAVMLDGMMRAEQPQNCPLDVTDDERHELSAFLTAWYGERTAAPTTGNAAADAAVAKLVGRRDAVCACKNLECARSTGTGLDAELAALPSDTPKVARDAAAKMIDEVARCRQKLAYGRPTP